MATFYETAEIFRDANVDLRNFIRLIICESVILHWLDIDGSNSNEYLSMHHDETRGCLFDMCGLKQDIIMSATKPKICFACEAKLRAKALPSDLIDFLKREFRLIKKPLYYRVADWIKKHPLLALLITAISSIAISLFSSFLYDLIKP